MTVQETIPESLRPEVEAALEWFNGQQESPFEATGILDPEATLASSGGRALRLILCSGERCEQHSFEVTAGSDGYEVALLPAEPSSSEASTLAELDPPPGPRRAWLDGALEKHAFVVLVFYRGFW